jgi:glycosyltransferase involved in cell wall biosynthesis
MRVLVWQWGRFGAMPRVAMLLTEALRTLPGTEAILSLSTNAELLDTTEPPNCDVPVDTYDGPVSYALLIAGAPFEVGKLARRIAELRPDVAVCVHPAALDLLMTAALNRLRVPFIALVHDADLHPGDGLPLQMWLQRIVCRQAAAIGVFTKFVGEQLLAKGLAGTSARPLIQLCLPPIGYLMPSIHDRRDGHYHLLMFGRLLAYKGLDLLAGALKLLGPRPELAVRVVGSGPESAELRELRALPGVTVENRWVPEDEIGSLLAWSDALVLPYREASQSGVAAAALAAGRWVLATRVGGLPEQLSGAMRAILCDPDETSLAKELRDLMDGPRGTAVPAENVDLAWCDMAASLMRQIETLELCRGD